MTANAPRLRGRKDGPVFVSPRAMHVPCASTSSHLRFSHSPIANSPSASGSRARRGERERAFATRVEARSREMPARRGSPFFGTRQLRSGFDCWPLRRVQSEPSCAGETTVDTWRERQLGGRDSRPCLATRPAFSRRDFAPAHGILSGAASVDRHLGPVVRHDFLCQTLPTDRSESIPKAKAMAAIKY